MVKCQFQQLTPRLSEGECTFPSPWRSMSHPGCATTKELERSSPPTTYGAAKSLLPARRRARSSAVAGARHRTTSRGASCCWLRPEGALSVGRDQPARPPLSRDWGSLQRRKPDCSVAWKGAATLRRTDACLSRQARAREVAAPTLAVVAPQAPVRWAAINSRGEPAAPRSTDPMTASWLRSR